MHDQIRSTSPPRAILPTPSVSVGYLIFAPLLSHAKGSVLIHKLHRIGSIALLGDRRLVRDPVHHDHHHGRGLCHDRRLGRVRHDGSVVGFAVAP